MASAQPPTLPLNTGETHQKILPVWCTLDHVDTGQFETLRLLCLSPKLGGFHKNRGNVFAIQTCHLSSPISCPGTPRCTQHISIQQIQQVQPEPYLLKYTSAIHINLFQHWTNFVKLDRANLALLRKVLERPSPHLPRLLPRYNKKRC